MKHGFKLGETEFDVALSRAAQAYLLHVGSHALPVDLRQNDAGDWVLHCGTDIDPVTLASHGDDVFIHLNGETHHLRYEHPLQRLAELAEGAAQDTVRATMPGSLVSLHVEAGQTVAKGDTLLVMESMKMETSISAARDAVIDTVHVTIGETFDKDAVLITLAATGEPA